MTILFAAIGVAAIGLLGFLAWRLAQLESALRDEQGRNRQEFGDRLRDNREEMSAMNKSLLGLSALNETKLENVRKTVEERLGSLQRDNNERLEHIRVTVDEKLHDTLEKRLGLAFASVQKNLEMVQQGLGEMRTLATGVGDLQRVLTNVKTRGIRGEVQLGSLLEDLLTPDQYVTNVATKQGSSDRVEYAIKLSDCLLPIDSKFPLECYERMQKCFEKGDLAAAEACRRELVVKVKDEAKSIRDKYVDPPNTTEHAILFVPFESVYAEIVSMPGLYQQLQNDYRVTVAGPTNLGAILGGLRMGFRTLAIQKRSNEVWNLLGAVKAEFGKFALILEKTQKKLYEATNTLDDAAKKTRTIEKKLKDVERLPDGQARELIGPDDSDDDSAPPANRIDSRILDEQT